MQCTLYFYLFYYNICNDYFEFLHLFVETIFTLMLISIAISKRWLHFFLMSKNVCMYVYICSVCVCTCVHVCMFMWVGTWVNKCIHAHGCETKTFGAIPMPFLLFWNRVSHQHGAWPSDLPLAVFPSQGLLKSWVTTLHFVVNSVDKLISLFSQLCNLFLKNLVIFFFKTLVYAY